MIRMDADSEVRCLTQRRDGDFRPDISCCDSFHSCLHHRRADLLPAFSGQMGLEFEVAEERAAFLDRGFSGAGQAQGGDGGAHKPRDTADAGSIQGRRPRIRLAQPRGRLHRRDDLQGKSCRRPTGGHCDRSQRHFMILGGPKSVNFEAHGCSGVGETDYSLQR